VKPFLKTVAEYLDDLGIHDIIVRIENIAIQLFKSNERSHGSERARKKAGGIEEMIPSADERNLEEARGVNHVFDISVVASLEQIPDVILQIMSQKNSGFRIVIHIINRLLPISSVERFEAVMEGEGNGCTLGIVLGVEPDDFISTRLIIDGAKDPMPHRQVRRRPVFL
jgi:hypothetical protein